VVPTVYDAAAALVDAQTEIDTVLLPADEVESRPEMTLTAMGDDAGRRVIVYGRPEEGRSIDDALGAVDARFLPLPPDADRLREALTPTPEVGPTRPVVPQGLPEVTPELMLDVLEHHPGESAASLLAALSDLMPAGTSLVLQSGQTEPDGLSQPLADGRRLHLVHDAPEAMDEAERDVLLHDLAGLATQVSRFAALDTRHTKLQRLALTDELTGCANKRYFRHFLDRILERARSERFPVSLLLFDIDNFKSYNDRHGHLVGDQILKQTSGLIKRGVRDHDIVARIGGDEFAVIFWEKEPPESGQPCDKRHGGRVPKGPLQIATRFRKMMSAGEFAALGETGVGKLTISGGMAVFPYDANDAASLVAAADLALMRGAKQSGKNRIALVGR
jgi:GGDEF domain-containing protein